MSRSVFRLEKVLYTSLSERLKAHPYRMSDRELSVEKHTGVKAGPSPDYPEAMGMTACIPGGKPHEPPKHDTTDHMTRRQRALL